ncbi:uncharacterized protein ALTATR162_LOCUS4837 [Alternaria atra]|uniref:RZ-type domain-containing protein n=1 Tax=Alternaria atra TaxID=119953 RepID=A0A8J2N170_9PLEO|nr:uncharacterized protein ALTATR162_LOCUS4837 [Alternaria atra]CAG5157044.1 unnamed protein product [Alternaria atra]
MSGCGGGRNARGGRGGRGRGRGRGGNTQGRHDTNTQHASKPVRAKETEQQRQARKSYSSWKRRLGEAETDPTTMRRLWEGAVSILENGDRDWRQQLPQDLNDDSDDEGGRRHILAILSTKIENPGYDTFLSNARNFLLTLTHPSLLRCLAVDTHVGSIYNLFGGVGGRTAVLYLQRVCKALSAARAATFSLASTKDHETTLLAMAMALFELLRRERRARFNDDVIPLVNSIQTASDACKGSPDTSARITNRLNDTRALVARAQGLLAEDTGDNDTGDKNDGGGQTSSYPRNLVVPSGRFDNDKKDIGDLILFPTRDEIMTDEKEFLPYTDPDQPHFLEDPVQRHIDTYFRLLRHDIFGELKGSLAGIMHAVSQDPNALAYANLGDMRANQYTNARVCYVALDKRKGLQAHIEFLQPAIVRKKNAGQKEKWWEESRRFDEGSLLSFIWIQDTIVQHVFLTVSDKTTDPKKKYSLTHHNQMAYITTSLVTQDRTTVKTLMHAHIGATRGILLEFPKVMPATFAPTLESLQAMQRLNRLPFRQWIVPDKYNGPPGERGVQKIPPPLYARASGFKFPATTLMKDKNDEPFSIDPASSCDDKGLLDKLETKTQLDRGQCRALIAALTREFAFIQGPPGTGKSYLGLQIMRILLDIKKQVNLGPILIVCYTNHALDQFLEHLLDIGVNKLIRMGGMSKSKKLLNHNLRTIGDTETKTKSEKYMAAMNYKDLDENEKEARKLFAGLHGLSKRTQWNNLKSHIHEEYPKIYNQFRRVDDQGFQTAGRHPFDVWIAGSEAHRPALSPDALRQVIQKAIANVFSLSIHERRALLGHWVAEAQGNKVSELFEVVNSAAKTQRQLNNIHDELNRRILEGADVIGVTTSGLAKRISVLQQVKCKVIICEEAGEVMESHMISALLPDVEHLIQIGDHEQLRPSVSNFRDLSLESERGKLHALDRSQFERLSIGEPGRLLMPVAQLNVQRRMRPQISSLIRETIYDKLRDHASTTELPDVVGLRRNVFWLDHTNLENENDTDMHNSKSKSNLWEVKMVHALVRHVVRQGVYKPDDIAVLTPYTGQLQKLRAAMRTDFEICLSDRDREALERDGFAVDDNKAPENAASDHEGYQGKPLARKQLSELLRVATVDNFQGEEAKIIIVSLVRSNERQNVGFLKTTNRINVLLSRAQHGMYLIGNADTYSSVEMWQKVIGMLRATNSWSSTLLARKHVAESMGLAITTATVNVMMVRIAVYARSHVKYVASTQSVHKSAMSLALRALSYVYGHVNIKATARCLVRPHAAAYLATSAAPSSSYAATSVQAFAVKSEALPDMIMMSRYADIDLNESPIVILSCGHFFTTETLDGLVGLKDVYSLDATTGLFNGLIENAELSPSVPQCPNCREPVKQYVTQRYNRLINKAVIDDMSKRFIVNGQQELQQIEGQLEDVRKELEKSRRSVVPASAINIPGEEAHELTMQYINDGIKNRSADTVRLLNAVKAFRRRMDVQHQPTYTLHQATLHTIARDDSLDAEFAKLTIDSSEKSTKRDRDQRITLGGSLLEIKVRCLVLEDSFEIMRAVSLKHLRSTVPLSFPAGSPVAKTDQFLKDTEKLIGDCIHESLPKLAVEAILHYARVTQSFSGAQSGQNNDRAKATDYRNLAKNLLKTANKLCEHSFRDRNNLRQAVIAATKMLDKEFYEAVSGEELESIKKAMVSGRGGIATHSGHWYKCVNGHPFAIGECGMPMELARCPECGEPVGGRSHTAVAGVSRATEMEH